MDELKSSHSEFISESFKLVFCRGSTDLHGIESSFFALSFGLSAFTFLKNQNSLSGKQI
ncbi:hypothetical protein HDC90_002863 [Pedobacter sp. AK013]|nr:hypothetical protein [Pedobacter sp. AK013]